MAADGVATFFCCGSNSGWSNWCSSANQGYCNSPGCGSYICSDNTYGMAHPVLNQCGASCSHGGCGYSIPTHSCGDSVQVLGHCTGNGLYLPIVDCGPRTDLECGLSSQYDCVDWSSCIVDLTPAAYYYLNGGQGDIGPIAVTVNW